MLNGDNTDENKQPNLGKDVASATNKDKASLVVQVLEHRGDGDRIMKKKPVIRRFSNNDLMN